MRTPGHHNASRQISYIQALQEPDYEKRVPLGVFHSVTVEFPHPVKALPGEPFVAESADVVDVMNDTGPFMNIRNVRFIDFVEAYEFLAVGKQQTHMLRF